MKHRIDVARFFTGILNARSLCLALSAAWIGTAAAQTALPIANASFEDGAAVSGVPSGWTLTTGSASALGVANGGSNGTKMLWIGPNVSIRQDLAHTLVAGEELTLQYKSSRGDRYARKIQLHAKSGATYQLLAETTAPTGNSSWPTIELSYQVAAEFAGKSLALQIVGDDSNDTDADDWNEFDNFRITTSMSVANPYAWFRSDQGLTLDSNGKVTNWETQTSSGADLSRVAGTPVTSTMMRSGGATAKVVRFDGSSSLWASATDFGTLSGSRTVVVRARLAGTGDGFLFDGSTGGGITRAQVRGGMWQVGVQSSSFSNADPATVAITPNVWQTHVFQYEESGTQTTCSHWVDGVLAGSNVVSTNTSLGGLIVGENGATALGLQVEVAEVQVFHQLLSTTQRNLVQQGVTDRWGDLVDLPFTYQSSKVLQPVETVASTGTQGVAALEILSTGSSPGDALTSLSFNLNGTTDPSDIEEILLYTSNSADFSPQKATLLASAPATAGTFTLNAPITSNTQYFWLAAKLAGTSEDKDTLDAEVTQFTLAGSSAGIYVPSITAPPEHVTIRTRWFHSVEIRKQGDDGVNTYRIPGLATSKAGTLLAVFDIRYNGSGDLPGNIDVGLMRSTDGGHTWGSMQAIMNFDASVANSSGNGVGDPSILVDRNTGRIWCAALWSFGNRAWNGSGPGLTETETGQFVVNYSDDDGLTWSAPVSITPQIKNPAWNLYFNGPGKGICTRDGTLIFPAQYRDSSGIAHSNFIYSTDNGQTWKNSPPAYVNGSEWTSEAQIVELDNGDLLISMRNYVSRKERLWNIFSWNHETQTIDNGTWGSAWYEQADPTCMASVETYSSKTDGDPWSGVLFANPDSSTSREKMSIRLSLDQGRTWSYKKKIDDRPAAYSCMTMLADGDIGILYETGDSSAYQTLTFARFPLDWIVGTRDTDGDGISDFEEMARRGPPKPLTELRTAAPVSIIPFPRDLIWLPQDSDATRVVIERPSRSSVVLDHAEALLNQSLTQAGAVVIPADGSETCTIRLITGPVIHPDGSDEVYSLETTAEGVTITSPSDAGLLYGVQTLLQLVKTSGGSPWIAGCSIIDWPAFGVRGFMHDVGRNFQSIELLKKQIDAFARYKLNTFHWHLTENAAWRIQSTLYPQLTDAAHHWPTREPGQFYTKQEILDFVNYCAARNITVIPEIDIPGHSEAFRKAIGVTSMSDPLVVGTLVNIVNELCDLLPADLVPRIHFGTDEVRNSNETPHPDLIPSVVSTARNRGREVITWWGGITPVDNSVINQVWAPHSPRAGNPFIDSRDMYINHFDALDGPAISYFQQICRTPKETDTSLGGILCYWPDINIDDPDKGLSIAPVFSSMVAFSERIWRGASANYPEYWAKLPPAGHPLLAEFAEFEEDLTVHRDKYFAGVLPFPYVRQTDVEWKIIGPFDHGGNLAQSFGPESGILPSYQHGGNTYTWTDAIGGTVHLKHFFGYPSYTTAGSGTYYALTNIESDTERDVDFWFEFGTHSVSNRRNGGNPPPGKWNAYEAQVWVNGEAVAPPVRNNPGLLANGDEIPFTNEGYFYREPTRVRLKAGSNQILLRVPHGAYNGYPAHKWMFTCMPIDWDGTQARELEGITFNTTLPAIPPTRTEKAGADLTVRFEGNEIYNGSSYINGWTETNASGANETLNGSDVNRTHVSVSESWIGGTTLSKDGGVTTWDTGNGGDWTVETRMRFNECSNGFAIWLGTGSKRIVVEVFADRTQDLGGDGFVRYHNNEDGNYHVFRIAHDSANGRYHVWRDVERLTPIEGAPYDATATDSRVILGDYTGGSFGNNANVDIDHFSYDPTGDYLPVGADADGDGMPDAWEFLHSDDLTAVDAQADDDGDGSNNLEEFLAGTHPGERTSRLRVEGPVAAGGNTWRISVPDSSPNRIYTLQSTDDLSAPDSWRNVPGQGPRAGNGGALDFTETADSPRNFFRVAVSLP